MVNGLELLQPFDNKAAGQSTWTFARYKGRDFFLKQFLSPVYPVNDKIGPDQRKTALEICRAFEEEYIRLYSRINKASDGNLVRVEAFFRQDSHYYIAMDMIEEEKLPLSEVSRLPMEERVRLCRIIAHSIMRLHAQKVVHADLKADNVLICRLSSGKYTAKIIDYESGFREEAPPKPGTEMAGDVVYLAPEVCRFIFDEPVKLTCRLDIFSLGILFHQLLSGELPGFDSQKFDYLCQAVLDGHPPEISGDIPRPLSGMIAGMLQKEPQKRLTAQQVWDILKPEIPEEPEDPASYFKMVTKL